MKFLKLWKPVFFCIITIVIVLVVASLFDILLAVFNSRFYSNVAFIVVFGVAGVFASILGYANGMEAVTEKNETARWTLIILIIITGMLFFFFLSTIEGGEYEPAFRSFGVTTALSSLLFVRGNKIW